MNTKNLYVLLPNVDEYLNDKNLKELTSNYTRNSLLNLIREEINSYRTLISKGEITASDKETIYNEIKMNIINSINSKNKNVLKRVINGSGVVIHTNLGRAVLADSVAQKVYDLTTSYTNLEYDTTTGLRRTRMHYIEQTLCDLTGAESALVVNNNASSVYLILNSLAKNKDVILSRGEMVEVGDGFRISSIIEESGCNVIEVGTTNKTTPQDYEEKTSDNTAVYLKVHCSNFKIVGFTKSIETKELSSLAKGTDIVVVEDMGSGVLCDLEHFGQKSERTVQQAIKEGADIVCFSGDKLLGASQAGIIVGKKKYIDKLKKNQMLRCLRIDKMCLIALSETLNQYTSEEKMLSLPIFKSASEPLDNIKLRGNNIINKVNNPNITLKLLPHKAMFGGGSLPTETFQSYGIFITHQSLSASLLESKLRDLSIPIITVIQNDTVIINLSTIFEKDEEYIVESLSSI